MSYHMMTALSTIHGSILKSNRSLLGPGPCPDQSHFAHKRKDSIYSILCSSLMIIDAHLLRGTSANLSENRSVTLCHQKIGGSKRDGLSYWTTVCSVNSWVLDYWKYIVNVRAENVVSTLLTRSAASWVKNKKAQLTQRERATAVHVWRPTANKCKIHKNLCFSAEGHSRSLLSVSIETRVWLPISD